MVRAMAAAAPLNNAVGNALTNTPGVVREAIRGKATVLAALEASGLLAGLPADQVGEVHWVLAHLTPEQNQTVLQSIASTLDAGQTAQALWVENAIAGVDVTDIPGGKRVTIHTPMPPPGAH
jgi:hypothetical protein